MSSVRRPHASASLSPTSAQSRIASRKGSSPDLANWVRRIRFFRAQPGQLSPVQNRRRPRSNRYWARLSYGVSALLALGGVAWLADAVVSGASWAYLGLGCMWLVLAAAFIPQARQFSRRERLGFDRALPVAEQDVVTLLRQGRNIEAIKRYRDLNPGVRLREAKLVIDGLKPGVDHPGTSST